MANYNENFYKTVESVSNNSAKEFLPIVKNIIPKLETAVDFGCGTGEWLFTMKKLYGTKIHGYDGDYAKGTLVIDNSEFTPINFETTMPPAPTTKVDLAMSVEVAEHIDVSRARAFVDALCQQSDYILFGAARPKQGGLHHVNEQPQSYWANMFIDNGYTPVDLRLQVLFLNKISYFYRQNTLLYVKDIKTINYPVDWSIKDQWGAKEFKKFVTALNKSAHPGEEE
jgi:cyclopropane fatty-acyl-phospholipid synthase-like methyltransferase